MSVTPDAIIRRVPGWETVNIKIELLAGGITNHNYRVEVNNETFVLRISGENTELLGINRQQEYLANQEAAGINIAPPVIHYIEPEGYLVTQFINGDPIAPQKMRQPTIIRQVAEILKQVHALPPIQAQFSPFKTVEIYHTTALQYGVSFSRDFDTYRKHMHTIETAFLNKPFEPRLCHNDLLNENFLHDGDIRILDWEYAGMGDVFFDLANFAAHHQFTIEEEHLLLGTYFGEVTQVQIAKLNLMKIMSNFREAMWGMVQQGISTLDYDYKSYSSKYFTLMARQLNNPQYGRWLEDLRSE